MNDTMQILSFNPETDFELMAYESIVDNAYNEYAFLLEQKKSFCLEYELESVFSILSEGDIAEEKAYDSAALEKAEGSFKEKIVAAWKAFKAKVVSFFRKVVETIKNLVSRIQANVAAKMVSDKKAYALGEAKYEFLNNLLVIEKMMENFKYGDSGVVIPQNEELIADLNKLIKIGNESEEGVRRDRRNQLLNNQRKLIAIDGSELKKWLSSINNIIKNGSRVIAFCDKLVNDMNKEKSTHYDESTNKEEPMNSDSIEESRKIISQVKEVLQLSITASRKGISFITETISSSDQRRKAMKKDTEQNILV